MKQETQTHILTGFSLAILFVGFILALNVGMAKSDRMHKQNLCASAELSQNVKYLTQCKEWGMNGGDK